jgi:hypothetical protein
MPDYVPGSAANLPSGAADRLRAMRGTGDRPAFFTSDLTVDEFLLVEQAGFEALGLVMGSSIYHVGFQWQKWSVSQELDVLSKAMYQARELAHGGGGGSARRRWRGGGTPGIQAVRNG